MLVSYILRAANLREESQNQHLIILVVVTLYATDRLSPLATPQLGVKIYITMVTGTNRY